MSIKENMLYSLESLNAPYSLNTDDLNSSISLPSNSSKTYSNTERSYTSPEKLLSEYRNIIKDKKLSVIDNAVTEGKLSLQECETRLDETISKWNEYLSKKQNARQRREKLLNAIDNNDLQSFISVEIDATFTEDLESDLHFAEVQREEILNDNNQPLIDGQNADFSRPSLPLTNIVSENRAMSPQVSSSTSPNINRQSWDVTISNDLSQLTLSPPYKQSKMNQESEFAFLTAAVSPNNDDFEKQYSDISQESPLHNFDGIHESGKTENNKSSNLTKSSRSVFHLRDFKDKYLKPKKISPVISQSPLIRQSDYHKPPISQSSDIEDSKVLIERLEFLASKYLQKQHPNKSSRPSSASFQSQRNRNGSSHGDGFSFDTLTRCRDTSKHIIDLIDVNIESPFELEMHRLHLLNTTMIQRSNLVMPIYSRESMLCRLTPIEYLSLEVKDISVSQFNTINTTGHLWKRLLKDSTNHSFVLPIYLHVSTSIIQICTPFDEIMKANKNQLKAIPWDIYYTLASSKLKLMIDEYGLQLYEDKFQGLLVYDPISDMYFRNLIEVHQYVTKLQIPRKLKKKTKLHVVDKSNRLDSIWNEILQPSKSSSSKGSSLKRPPLPKSRSRPSSATSTRIPSHLPMTPSGKKNKMLNEIKTNDNNDMDEFMEFSMMLNALENISFEELPNPTTCKVLEIDVNSILQPTNEIKPLEQDSPFKSISVALNTFANELSTRELPRRSKHPDNPETITPEDSLPNYDSLTFEKRLTIEHRKHFLLHMKSIALAPFDQSLLLNLVLLLLSLEQHNLAATVLKYTIQLALHTKQGGKLYLLYFRLLFMLSIETMFPKSSYDMHFIEILLLKLQVLTSSIKPSIELFTSILQICQDEEHPIISSLVASLLSYFQLHEDAEKLYISSLILDPLCEDALLRYGSLLAYQRNLSSAMKYLCRITSSSNESQVDFYGYTHMNTSSRSQTSQLHYTMSRIAIAWVHEVGGSDVHMILKAYNIVLENKSKLDSQRPSHFINRSYCLAYQGIGYQHHISLMNTTNNHIDKSSCLEEVIKAYELAVTNDQYQSTSYFLLASSLSITSEENNNYDITDAIYRRGITCLKKHKTMSSSLEFLSYADFLVSIKRDYISAEFYYQQALSCHENLKVLVNISIPTIALAHFYQYIICKRSKAKLVLLRLYQQMKKVIFSSIDDVDTPNSNTIGLNFLRQKKLSKNQKNIEVSELNPSQQLLLNDYVSLCLALGYFYLDEDDLEQSLEYANEGLRLKESFKPLYRLLGILLYQSTRISNAKTQSNPLVNIDNIIKLIHKSNECYLIEKLKYQQENPYSLRSYSIAFAMAGQFKHAYSAMEKAISIFPSHATSWKCFAIMNYIFKGSIEASIECMKNAISLYKTDVDAFLFLGQLYLELDCFQEAMNCFREALQLHPTSCILWLHLTISLFHIKEKLSKKANKKIQPLELFSTSFIGDQADGQLDATNYEKRMNNLSSLRECILTEDVQEAEFIALRLESKINTTYIEKGHDSNTNDISNTDGNGNGIGNGNSIGNGNGNGISNGNGNGIGNGNGNGIGNGNGNGNGIGNGNGNGNRIGNGNSISSNGNSIGNSNGNDIGNGNGNGNNTTNSSISIRDANNDYNANNSINGTNRDNNANVVNDTSNNADSIWNEQKYILGLQSSYSINENQLTFSLTLAKFYASNYSSNSNQWKQARELFYKCSKSTPSSSYFFLGNFYLGWMLDIEAKEIEDYNSVNTYFELIANNIKDCQDVYIILKLFTLIQEVYTLVQRTYDQHYNPSDKSKGKRYPTKRSKKSITTNDISDIKDNLNESQLEMKQKKDYLLKMILRRYEIYSQLYHSCYDFIQNKYPNIFQEKLNVSRKFVMFYENWYHDYMNAFSICDDHSWIFYASINETMDKKKKEEISHDMIQNDNRNIKVGRIRPNSATKSNKRPNSAKLTK